MDYYNKMIPQLSHSSGMAWSNPENHVRGTG